MKPFPSHSKSFVRGIEFLILAFILIANALFLKFNAFRCFNFFDMSFPLDGGWRLLHGQRPYVDFIYFNTPLHLGMMALFFKIFGFGKTAVWAHVVVVHSIVISANFLVARRYLNVFLTALVTCLTTACFYWPISFPWHDQTAHFWGLLGLTALLLNAPKPQRPTPPLWVSFFCGAMGLLSWMSKINIGSAYLFFFGIVLLSHRNRLRHLGLYLLGLFSAAAITSPLISDGTRFWEQVAAFGGLFSSRFHSFLNFQNWVANFYWLPFLIVLGNLLVRPTLSLWWLLVYGGFSVVCFFSLITGGMLLEGNIFLWGNYLTLCFILLKEMAGLNRPRPFKKLLALSRGALVFLTIFLTGFAAHDGWTLKVWSYPGKDYLGNYSLKSAPLQGWQFKKQEGEVLDKMVVYIKENVPPQASLFILSDRTILYALSGHESYRGIPISPLIPDHTPPPGRLWDQVRDTLRKNPPDWILTEIPSFLTLTPYLKFETDFAHSYVLVESWGAYALFKKR